MENKPDIDPSVPVQSKLKDLGSFSQKPLNKMYIFGFLSLLVLASALYVGTQLDKRPNISNKTVVDTSNPVSHTSTPSISLPPEQLKKVEPYTSVPPEKFGFTKTVTLESIGIRGKFLPDVTVSLQEENTYVISASESDQVNLALKPYERGGRRAWFQREYPWTSEYQIEPFVGKGHSGYIAYAVKEKDLPGAFFYFAVIENRMFIVTGTNNPGVGSHSVFFSSDVQRFKSFLASLELITPKLTELDTYPKMSDLFRCSDTRKTIWEDADLGIKVTAPEWTESRYTKGRDSDGKFIYKDWTRGYPQAQTDSVQYLSDTVLRTQVTGGYTSSQFIMILPSRLQGKTFSEVANELLIAGGFCATEWRTSKDECTGQNYCYTKDEVIQHLYAKRNTDIGSLVAQLWSMDSDFSITNDCRSEDVWLIRGANGQYISTGIAPDGEVIRLETL